MLTKIEQAELTTLTNKWNATDILPEQEIRLTELEKKRDEKQRMLCWFSCGAASAVATKNAITDYDATYEVVPVCCDTRPSEHEDNYRFSKECELWFGRPIIYISSEKYSTVDEVFEKSTYMSGIKGAQCTVALKKKPRFKFARPDDTHVFGFTFDEQKRIREFSQRNPDLILKWVLANSGITKQDCYRIVQAAGIRLPAMYLLGFDNNNCPGCVKASSPWYWDMVRTHFPEIFKRRCEQSRRIGCRLVEIRSHVRIFLDELPPGPFKKWRKKEQLSCGPECGVAQPIDLMDDPMF